MQLLVLSRVALIKSEDHLHNVMVGILTSRKDYQGFCSLVGSKQRVKEFILSASTKQAVLRSKGNNLVGSKSR